MNIPATPGKMIPVEKLLYNARSQTVFIYKLNLDWYFKGVTFLTKQ